MSAAPLFSTSRSRSAGPWPTWLPAAPILVAEALARVADPLAAWLRPGALGTPQAVAAELARALLPREAPDPPPPWLRPDQRLSFARALAAVRRHGGVLLADSVGTGKTYIGLAVAAALVPAHPIHVLTPASLVTQWRKAAERAGLEILPHSHETLSRGRAPPSVEGAVVIDESHRFRTPSTRRYATLAPWCVGRRGLLLSATPAVNRIEDAIHQLLLLVRDDELGPEGIPSLKNPGLAPEAGGGVLADLIVTGEDRTALLPAGVARDIRPDEPADSPLPAMLLGIDRLRLARDRTIAALLRVTLLQALASSPLALADALRRYRSLLLHARDATRSGRVVSRQTIRRIVGAEVEQLVLWPLVAEDLASPDLALEDLAEAGTLEEAARGWSAVPDAKLTALAVALADRTPTLVFTTSRATVRHLRRHLGNRGIAWCTGSASGLGGNRIPREDVLDWFRRLELRSDEVASRPSVLIATDVAAEGLDLPLVQRVVHYDLPWTAMRLEQRSGRALRLGAQHDRVEIIRFLPPPALEAALRQVAILRTKVGLPARLGLGSAGNAPWRLRAQLASRWADLAAAAGVAASWGESGGAVAGFRIVAADGTSREVVIARTEGGWSRDIEVIAPLLEQARGMTTVRAPHPPTLRATIRQLAIVARAALRSAHGRRLLLASPLPSRRALRRVLSLAKAASRARDGVRLALLERGRRFLCRGHTAGESIEADQWAVLPEQELVARLARLEPEPPVAEVERIELIGVLLVERREVSG